MGVFVKKEGQKVVRYGLDQIPVPGYFATIFDGDTVVADLDTREGMAETVASRGRIAEVLKKEGVDEQHVTAVLLDLPL
jgi:hypothetical protein